MLSRRDFIQWAGGFILAPSIALTSPVRDETLRFIKGRNDDWGINWYTVQKGLWSTRVYNNSMTDLRDCHGLCATVEMAHVLKMDLEYGNNIRFLWELPFETPEEERERTKKKIQRCTVTENELKQLVRFCHRLRGKHDCVYDYRRKTVFLRTGV
jgi:hypothetical protein